MIAQGNESFVDLPEVAKHLRISRSMLYKAVSKKAIPFYRVGNRLRFKLSEIESWVVSHDLQKGHV